MGITFWIPRTCVGSRFLGLESWAWIPGLGFLDLAENQNLNENPLKTYDLEPEIVQTLHKLARALQVTLTWWGGLREIGRESFDIPYATI